MHRYLSLTAAVYRLDRTNTTARDPNDPSRTVQTGSQRTNGYELGVNGNLTRKWRIVGGYAYQDAFVSSATLAAAMGAKVALVPHHTFSLWNNYTITPRWGAGLGIIHQAEMFTGVDNTVTLARVHAGPTWRPTSLSPRRCVFRRTSRTCPIAPTIRRAQQQQHHTRLRPSQFESE